jgi:hypothetical protein
MSDVKQNFTTFTLEELARYSLSYNNVIYKAPVIYSLKYESSDEEVARMFYINAIIIMMLYIRLETYKYNIQVYEYNENKKFRSELINTLKDLSNALKFASIQGPEYLNAKKSFNEAVEEYNSMDSLD